MTAKYQGIFLEVFEKTIDDQIRIMFPIEDITIVKKDDLCNWTFDRKYRIGKK